MKYWLTLFLFLVTNCAWGADISPGNKAIYPVYGANGTYGESWDGDGLAPEKDDIYDYLILLDTDGDGDVDSINASLGGGDISKYGTPVNGDFTKFTDANHIEGCNATKMRSDLNIEDGATADQTGAEIKALYEAEADTNAYTDTEKTKLSGIASGAEVNVQSDWDQSNNGIDDFIKNKPTLYTDLTQFVAQTAWRVFYSDASGDVTELSLGANGTFLKSTGPASIPIFSTPSGAGDVVGPASNTDGYIPLWNGANSKVLANGVANDSSNWGTAYSERRQWDGGNTNLVAATGRTSLGLNSAALRTAEDAMTDGSNLPDGHAIKVYGDSNWGGGYTNLTQFINQTAWRLFYSNGSGDVTELALGTSDQYLKSNGATSIPSWSTPGGTGDVVGPGSTTNNRITLFDGATGKLIKDSPVTIDAAGAPTFPNNTALRWKQAGGAVKNVLAYDSVDNIVVGVDGDDATVYIERLNISSAGSPLQDSRRFSVVANYWKNSAEHQRMATIYHDMQSNTPKSTMRFEMGEDGAEVAALSLENDAGILTAIFPNQIKISGGSPGSGKILTSDATGLATWMTQSSSSKWTDHTTYISPTNTRDVVLTGTECFKMVGGVYSMTTGGADFRALSFGSTAIAADAYGLRKSMWSIFATDADNVDEMALQIQVIQRSGSGQRAKTGLKVSHYSQPDNGGDVSGGLFVETGGGSALTCYKAHVLRPAGYTNYQDSTQGAFECGTTDQSQAGLFMSGCTGWGDHTNAAECIWCRIDNEESKGILVTPGDGIFDSRQAFAVGDISRNNPVDHNLKFLVKLNGDGYFAGNIFTDKEIVFNNNKALLMKNTSGSNRVGIRLNSGNDWELGLDGGMVVIGYGCSNPNPIMLRIDGVNNRQVLVGAPNSGGSGHRMLKVAN